MGIPKMNMEIITKEYISSVLPPRRRDCNKGDNGKGLVAAGSNGFAGAAVMASASALRAGAGMIKTVAPEELRNAFAVLPEVMFFGIENSWGNLPSELLAWSSAIAVGPGMGKSAGVISIVKEALLTHKPLVIDADGLNALSAIDDKSSVLHVNTILTPHPAEMSRLCRCDVKDVLQSPNELAVQKAREWNCIVLLKGANTVIAAPDGRHMLNTTGNSGLAKAGSGDVLTGIILAMLCQGLPPFDAACAGAYLLGASANDAMELLAERMLMARDVIETVKITLDRLF